MINYVEKSNLPHRAAKVLLGEKYAPSLGKAIEKLGIEPLYIPDNPYVDYRLSGHADLSCFHPGGKTLYLSKHIQGSALENMLAENGFKLIYPEKEIEKNYPYDALLNLCSVGDYLFCSEKASCKEAVKMLAENGKTIIEVKQGYCKCSICVVNDSSIITSDRGINAAAEKNGLDSLLIEPGYIYLEGYEYGFIGGCTFKADDNTMVFTGKINSHPDYDRILSFLAKHEVRPLFMTNNCIFDIGSILPFTELQQ